MNFIFDFDGTICDSFDITVRILNEYLTKLKKPKIHPKTFKEKGIEEIIQDYKLNKIQILIYIYKGRREIAKYIEEMKTFPGMAGVIRELSISNHLGIVSSNSKRNVETFLKNNNLEKYFEFIESSPTIFEKYKKIEKVIMKHGLEKSQTLYIGDEVRDIEAAKKAGIGGVSVAWGFASAKLLEKNKPDFIVEKPEELLRGYK